jgi:hypothetical protein
MSPLSLEYQSYLLRLWRDDPQAPWRASLQSTATGEIQGFADTASLVTFLVAQMGDGPTSTADAPANPLDSLSSPPPRTE